MKYLIVIILVSSALVSFSQTEQQKRTVKLQQVSGKLEKALESNDPNELANEFVKSAELYKSQQDFIKSEEYYKRAIVELEKINKTDDIAKLKRELALVQERLHKKNEALFNYKSSKSKISNNKVLDILNTNDIKRIEISSQKDSNSVLKEKELIQGNININLRNNNQEEVQQGYNKMAESYLKDNDKEGAIKIYEQAYSNSIKLGKINTQGINSTFNSSALNSNQQVTDIYLSQNKFDKAIETKKKLLSEPLLNLDIEKKLEETQKLAEIYFKKKETDSAIKILIGSYHLAIKNNLTIEARNSLERLTQLYKQQNKINLALPYYENFLTTLPFLIENDSSLIQLSIIKETEEKISQLIKEKELKDQLISRKDLFNYVLIGFIVVLVFMLGFILFSLRAIKRKNIEIELQSLRREMNPHFIFNSLNSINQFISQNDEKKANNYLTKFSNLMRGVMENSKDDFIFLSKEINVLENYLALEKSRFSDKFDFDLYIDEALIEGEDRKIPSMLIQPHIENAIWHGLRYTNSKGWLKVSFNLNSENIIVIVEDNGIGIEKSKELKTKHQSQHKGRGMNNTMERIQLLNQLYNSKINCEIIDKKGAESGVKITLFFPLLF
jgi:hypothetical protein